MIKAVFFDWMNTLTHAEPDRHEQFCQIAQELGIELSPQKVIRGIYAAGTQLPAGAPYRWRESEDPEVFIRYLEIILAEAGVKLPRDTVLEILKKISRSAKVENYVLYDDVLPTLKKLKKQGLIIGLITSLTKDMNVICSSLGLAPYLDFVVTAEDVGSNKPEPPIFLAALERAGVNASEAIYVGDQYETDVVGARGVGINPVLIDRYDLMPEVKDCLRIHNLTELAQYHLLADPEPLAVKWALCPARLGVSSALWGIRLGVRRALWGVKLAVGPALWLWRLVDRPILWLWHLLGEPTLSSRDFSG